MIDPESVVQARRTLGRHLAAYRRAAGLSQHELAESLYYGRSSIANVETGRQNVSREFWQQCDELTAADGALVRAYDELKALIVQELTRPLPPGQTPYGPLNDAGPDLRLSVDALSPPCDLRDAPTVTAGLIVSPDANLDSRTHPAPGEDPSSTADDDDGDGADDAQLWEDVVLARAGMPPGETCREDAVLEIRSTQTAPDNAVIVTIVVNGRLQRLRLNRRALLGAGLMSIGAALPADEPHHGSRAQQAVELIQQESTGLLDSAALDDVRRSLTDWDAVADRPDEWERIAWEHSRSYRTQIPEIFVADLEADLAEVGSLVNRASSPPPLGRAIGQMAALMAMSLTNLGQFGSARRWWRTARWAADTAGDPAARAWVRGHEAVHILYSRRPLQTAVDLADEVRAIATQPCDGAMEALAGKAQALALMGRRDEALQTVTEAVHLYELLPDAVTAERGSIFGWPEHRLRHTESFVYSQLGVTAAACKAQDRAFEIYPDTARRARALVQLHRARCHVHDGDIDDGAELGVKTVAAIPAQQRTALVDGMVRRIIEAVPPRERHRAAVGALREFTTPAGGPASWS